MEKRIDQSDRILLLHPVGERERERERERKDQVMMMMMLFKVVLAVGAMEQQACVAEVDDGEGHEEGGRRSRRHLLQQQQRPLGRRHLRLGLNAAPGQDAGAHAHQLLVLLVLVLLLLLRRRRHRPAEVAVALLVPQALQEGVHEDLCGCQQS